MKSFESITSEALLLPIGQRLSLANQLLASVEKARDPEVEKAWEDEIQRRIREFDSGKVKGIPGPEVFAELDKKLAQK